MNLQTELEKVLLELTKKRGKHSELWMYPKNESLNEAKLAILKLFREAVGKTITKIEKNKGGRNCYECGSDMFDDGLTVAISEFEEILKKI